MKLVIFLLGCSVAAANCSTLFCPPDWVLFKSSCYRYYGDRVTQYVAHDACSAFYTNSGRGHLVAIHSPEENAFAWDLFRSFAGDTPSWPPEPFYGAWIGLVRDGTGGEFTTWTDGSPFDYENWEDEQPNNWQGHQDCVFFSRRDANSDPTKEWGDINCDEVLPYICEVAPNVVG